MVLHYVELILVKSKWPEISIYFFASFVQNIETYTCHNLQNNTMLHNLLHSLQLQQTKNGN